MILLCIVVRVERWVNAGVLWPGRRGAALGRTKEEEESLERRVRPTGALHTRPGSATMTFAFLISWPKLCPSDYSGIKNRKILPVRNCIICNGWHSLLSDKGGIHLYQNTILKYLDGNNYA